MASRPPTMAMSARAVWITARSLPDGVGREAQLPEVANNTTAPSDSLTAWQRTPTAQTAARDHDSSCTLAGSGARRQSVYYVRSSSPCVSWPPWRAPTATTAVRWRERRWLDQRARRPPRPRTASHRRVRAKRSRGRDLSAERSLSNAPPGSRPSSSVGGITPQGHHTYSLWRLRTQPFEISVSDDA